MDEDLETTGVYDAYAEVIADLGPCTTEPADEPEDEEKDPEEEEPVDDEEDAPEEDTGAHDSEQGAEPTDTAETDAYTRTAGPQEPASGCACGRASPAPAWWLLLALVAARRRREHFAQVQLRGGR